MNILKPSFSLSANSKLRILLFSAVIVAIGLAVFHLGPRLGLASEATMLDTLSLSDGSRLYLVQNRNDSLLEAYTVHLFRDYPSNGVEDSQLGFEESYWWFPKLKKSPDGKSVDICAWGITECKYELSSKATIWLDRSYPPQAPVLSHGASLRRILRDKAP